MPTRDDVLAYIDATGCGAAEASAHFGGEPPAGTVRVWMKRRRDTVTAGRNGGKVGVEPVPVKAVASPPKPPADPPHARATPAPKAPPSLSPVLGVELRGYIRRGTRNLSRFIADANDPEAEAPMVLDKAAPGDEPRGRLANMNDVAAAARALKDLLSIAPDILTFDERTNATKPGDDAGDSDPLDAGVRRALERARTEAPAGGVHREGPHGSASLLPGDAA